MRSKFASLHPMHKRGQGGMRRRRNADLLALTGNIPVHVVDLGPSILSQVLRRPRKPGVGHALERVELHDATSPAELMYYEYLGLCPRNEGVALLESGATALGGRVPVNTSGGLVRKGHPIGATGLAQIYELTEQLRGRAGARQVEGARLAVAENGGGFLGRDAAALVMTVLSR